MKQIKIEYNIKCWKGGNKANTNRKEITYIYNLNEITIYDSITTHLKT